MGEAKGDVEQVHLTLSPEVQDVLAENGTSIEELLRKNGVQVNTRFATVHEAVGEKDVTLILIASAAVLAAATPILSRLLETLGNKPVKISKQKLKVSGFGLAVEFESEN